MKHERSAIRPVAAMALACVLAVAPGNSFASDDARGAAELVRRLFYEGLPYENARALGDAGAAQLVAMLDDPAEAAHYTNIVLALGIAARPGAYEALAGVAERGSSGAVDRRTYQLRTALPIAMGHLARSDDRAWAWLVARISEPGGDPGWSFGARAGQELADQLRRRAIAGIALSGRPAVDALLQQLSLETARRSAAADPELAAQIATARAVHARIASDGADAALAAQRAE